MKPLTAEQLEKLPKWARNHIRELERRVEQVELTLPWTEPGMQWFTLLKSSESQKLFLCDRDGTHCIASIGRGDMVFVGRAQGEQEGDT